MGILHWNNVAEKRQRKERQNVDDTHRAYQEASLLLLLLMLHCHCSRVQLYYSIFFNLHINDAAIIGMKMHEFSIVDGFVEISECMAEMTKYVVNEPSVGLFLSNIMLKMKYPISSKLKKMLLRSLMKQLCTQKIWRTLSRCFNQ
ncbi:hypothetical protein GmHk_20G058734 [Glycine max]|nr:hypothetical protein GmHk_20G058734 [Glycine max]